MNMKNFIFLVFGIISLINLSSCVNDTFEAVVPSTSSAVKLAKFAHRGNQPLQVKGVMYSFQNKPSGLIRIPTNYKDILVSFNDHNIDGLNLALDIPATDFTLTVHTTEEVVMTNPFFCQGGNIYFKVMIDGQVVQTHTLWYDIIATNEEIHAWGTK